MPIVEMPARPTLEENAALLRGLFEVNRAWLRRNPVPTLEELQACKYRRERPDRFSYLGAFLKRKIGDCEEFLTSGGAILEVHYPSLTVEGWLGQGLNELQQHCWLTIRKPYEKRAVLDLAVLAGMSPPPPRYYENAQAVKVF